MILRQEIFNQIFFLKRVTAQLHGNKKKKKVKQKKKEERIFVEY